MKKSKQFSKVRMKTCSLCRKSTEAEGTPLTYFGEWMSKKDITVHYYCLLLSTNLPQRGEDHNGILGFLLRDIRLEIAKAKNRKCRYCSDVGATIECFTCKAYFHLTCGHTSKCLSQFVGDFKSYCHDCIPNDPYKMELFTRKSPQTTELCYICAQIMGTNPKGWIYAKCCGNGFTHSKCMKIYALSAGYYLTCIWCKDKRFREDIKYLGIFVPDREANWEKEKGAYADLYCGHKRCDMEICNCPKGRDYSNAFKWQLIICKLCGAFGAHNPTCIPGYEGCKEKLKEFKCDICSVTEQTVLSRTIFDTRLDLNKSLYIGKNKTDKTEQDVSVDLTEYNLLQKPEFNSECESMSTFINTFISNSIPENTQQIQTAAYILTQSPVNSQQISASQAFSRKISTEDSSDSDDSIITNLLVQKVLNMFEVNSSHDATRCRKDQNEPNVCVHGQQNKADVITQPNLKPRVVFEDTESLQEIGHKENLDSDSSNIIDLLVDKVLDTFEAT